MEDRYEILGKIGQGGLGAVYRGFDTRMNREVAIKRISTLENDPDLVEQSTKQLVKEAGALASLQHPNIVTIHDVGSDADGPYVVMELISGKTLDELIERAPLTWSDFKELALQTQEALIAAQERNLIHSDLKPSNLMLTWLPSGKFQVKIVDFGLATLAQSQSKHDLESIDVVFGSIFFMPPEQFERTPLDIRSDMYSIGCVYYQALTGQYPFDGTTGNEVMVAHLHHKVTPIKDLRSGIPLWVCDWIMWHLNRYPQDRPESAREALSFFLQNDRISNPPMSLGVPATPAGPPRPRMRTPGTITAPGAPASAATGPATQALARAKMVQTSRAPAAGNESVAITQTAPQPLAPPEGFKPSVHASVPDIQPTAAPPSSGQVHRAATQRLHQQGPTRKIAAKSHRGAKIGALVSGVSLVIIAALIFFIITRNKQNTQRMEDILAKAAIVGATEVTIDGKTLEVMLGSLERNKSDSNLQRVCAALALAKTSDGTDVDARVANFVTGKAALATRVKERLIDEVLRPRKNSVILPSMLKLATSTDTDPALVLSALISIRPMMDDEHLEQLIHFITSTNNDQVREAAVLNIEELLKRSHNKAGLVKQLSSARESSFKPEVQQALKRLISLGDAPSPPKR